MDHIFNVAVKASVINNYVFFTGLLWLSFYIFFLIKTKGHGVLINGTNVHMVSNDVMWLFTVLRMTFNNEQNQYFIVTQTLILMNDNIQNNSNEKPTYLFMYKRKNNYDRLQLKSTTGELQTPDIGHI